MEKELKNSLDKSTAIFGLLALISSVFIIYTSLYFERENFRQNFAKLVAIDFAQIENQKSLQDESLAYIIDKYDIMSGQRFTIHSTEIFSKDEVGNFIFTSVGDREIRFNIKPVDSYFTDRILKMSAVALAMSLILISLVRLIFRKLVFENIINSNRQLNKILEISYSDQLTQQELIAYTQKLNKNSKACSLLRTTQKIIRRVGRLPKSST